MASVQDSNITEFHAYVSVDPFVVENLHKGTAMCIYMVLNPVILEAYKNIVGTIS